MKGTVYTLHAHGVRQQAARGGRVRRFPVFGRFVLCFFLSFVLVCQPYTLVIEGCQVKAQKQEAQAVPAAIPGALAFLEAMAAAAGMSVSDFMLTFGIGIAATTGYNMFKGNATYVADVTSTNIWQLKDTALWPSWSELTDSEKESWGSEDNYKAGQFNSALEAIGMNGARERWYSGGGSFDFTDEEENILTDMGAIGNKWKNGDYLPMNQINDLIVDAKSLFNKTSGGFGLQSSFNATYNGVKINFVIGYVNAHRDNYADITTDSWQIMSYNIPSNTYNYRQNLLQSPTITYNESYNRYEGTIQSNGTDYINGSNLQIRPNDNYFGVGANNGFRNVNLSADMQTTATSYALNFLYSGTYTLPDGTSFKPGDSVSGLDYGQDYGQMQDTPSDIIQDGLPENVDGKDGVGADGLTPSSTWLDLFRDQDGGGDDGGGDGPYPGTQYPESDFNPNVGDDGGDYVPETSTPEWQQQTQDQIFTPALNLPFDEMFPFCVIWDISKLMNKLYELGGYQAVSADQSTSLRSLYDKREGLQVQADIASKGGAQPNAWSKPGWTVGHTEFVLPVSSFGVDGMYDLELDVWPVAVLLAWLKPFFQLAFIAGLLYVTIVTFRMFIFTD